MAIKTTLIPSQGREKYRNPYQSGSSSVSATMSATGGNGGQQQGGSVINNITNVYNGSGMRYDYSDTGYTSSEIGENMYKGNIPFTVIGDEYLFAVNDNHQERKTLFAAPRKDGSIIWAEYQEGISWTSGITQGGGGSGVYTINSNELGGYTESELRAIISSHQVIMYYDEDDDRYYIMSSKTYHGGKYEYLLTSPDGSGLWYGWLYFSTDFSVNRWDFRTGYTAFGGGGGGSYSGGTNISIVGNVIDTKADLDHTNSIITQDGVDYFMIQVNGDNDDVCGFYFVPNGNMFNVVVTKDYNSNIIEDVDGIFGVEGSDQFQINVFDGDNDNSLIIYSDGTATLHDQFIAKSNGDIIVEEYVDDQLEGYNPTDNFKTINNQSIIGTGNITIQGGDTSNCVKLTGATGTNQTITMQTNFNEASIFNKGLVANGPVQGYQTNNLELKSNNALYKFKDDGNAVFPSGLTIGSQTLTEAKIAQIGQGGGVTKNEYNLKPLFDITGSTGDEIRIRPDIVGFNFTTMMNDVLDDKAILCYGNGVYIDGSYHKVNNVQLGYSATDGRITFHTQYVWHGTSSTIGAEVYFAAGIWYKVIV